MAKKMTHAKVELFNKEIREDAMFFKVLGHPARLSIIMFLAEMDTCFTGDISKEIPLGRTTINQHLNELKKIGLITGRISGAKVEYCLNQGTVSKLKGILRHIDCKLSVDKFFDCER